VKCKYKKRKINKKEKHSASAECFSLKKVVRITLSTFLSTMVGIADHTTINGIRLW
jgi:hypothetical protein